MQPNATVASGDGHRTFGGADERSVPTRAWAAASAERVRPAVVWQPSLLPADASGGGVQASGRLKQVVGADALTLIPTPTLIPTSTLTPTLTPTLTLTLTLTSTLTPTRWSARTAAATPTECCTPSGRKSPRTLRLTRRRWAAH
eukprot:scaffold71891_cov22-Phaeocystis_antarctica.AAC.1